MRPGRSTRSTACDRLRAALRRATVRDAIAAYVFLAPFLLVFGVFTLWPALSALWLSFHSYDLFSPARWVGTDNYRFLLSHGDFWISLRNTTLYTLVVVPIQTSLAVLLALVMDRKLRGRAFFRTAFFLPSVTSSVAISLVFMLMFFKNGVLNQALAQTHLDGLLGLIGLDPPVDWLGDRRTALGVIMIQNIWSTAGFFMIIALAGLQDVPETLYEAARVDAATAWNQFWHITLPSLRPTILYVVTMGLIGCFQVFDQVYVMTEGGPLKATLTTAYLLYEEAFVHFNMGYACAIAFVLATIIFVCTMAQRTFMEK